MFYCIGLMLKNGQPLYVGDAMHGSAWDSPIWQFSFEKDFGLALGCDKDEVKKFYQSLVHNMLCRKDVKGIFIIKDWYDTVHHEIIRQPCIINDSDDVVPLG